MLRNVATEAAPLVTGLEVVYLYAKDMARSAAFYRDLLGIRLEGDDDWLEAKLGATRFALHHWHEGAPEPVTGGIHVDFRVDDADAAAERLRAQGIDVREEMREEYGIVYAVTDPAGYEIYLFGLPR
jgi:predicted enzyme related to lactoylglutathione lyase